MICLTVSLRASPTIARQAKPRMESASVIGVLTIISVSNTFKTQTYKLLTATAVCKTLNKKFVMCKNSDFEFFTSFHKTLTLLLCLKKLKE